MSKPICRFLIEDSKFSNYLHLPQNVYGVAGKGLHGCWLHYSSTSDSILEWFLKTETAINDMMDLLFNGHSFASGWFKGNSDLLAHNFCLFPQIVNFWAD